jgi:GNAT superfamily N-acetyltransferase
VSGAATVQEGFDQNLWEGGVGDGAFSDERDPAGVWYLLEVGGEKVALAAAVPGPADLTNVSYYVHPDHRGHGYGTKIASRVTDLHEKPTFTIFKDNDVSIKVALAALRNKFSMTMGHNVVRLTKTANVKDERNTIGTTLTGRIHESFTVAADRMIQAGMMSERERIDLSGAIGELLGRFRKTVNKDVAAREMTPHAHDLLKKAVSTQTGRAVIEARTIQSKMKGLTSPQAVDRRISDAAGRVAKAPTSPLSPEERKKILQASRYVRMNVQDPKGGEIYKKIRAAELGKSHQMELPA